MERRAGVIHKNRARATPSNKGKEMPPPTPGLTFSCSSEPSVCIGVSGMGACNATTQQCACVGSDGPDLWFFHFPNCAVPGGPTLALTAMLAYFSVVLSITLSLALWQAWRSRRHARRIAACMSLAAALTWAFVLSLYLDGGCYESCAVVLAGMWTADYLFVGNLAVALLGSVYKVRARSTHSLSRVVAAWGATFAAAAWASGGTMLALTRDPQRQAMYNASALAMMLSAWVAGGALCLVVAVFAGRLLGEIESLRRPSSVGAPSSPALPPRRATTNTMLSPKLRAFIPRLRAARVGSAIVAASSLALTVVTPVVFALFGSSFPGWWIVTIFQLHVFFPLSWGTVFFLHRRKDRAAAKAAPASPALTPGAPAQPNAPDQPPLSPRSPSRKNSSVHPADNMSPFALDRKRPGTTSPTSSPTSGGASRRTHPVPAPRPPTTPSPTHQTSVANT